jgi:deoxyribonuclease IV
MRLGAHESVTGGLDRAFEHAAARAGEAIQIFTKNSNRWQEPVIAIEQIASFKAGRAAWGRGAVIAHGSYLINLCADRADILERSRSALVAELVRCDQLGIDVVAFHPGAALGLPIDTALDRIGESLDVVLEQTRGIKTRLCLENTAGQGSCLGSTLDEIGAIVERTSAGAALGVCLDTQHLFAAGHDLTTPAGYETFFSAFDTQLGLSRLAGFHLNDSKKPLGQRVDRHAEIGAGEMGLYPFWRLVNDRRFQDLPAVVELPSEEAAASLARLRELAGAPEPTQKRLVAPLQLTSPPPRPARSAKR